MLLGVDAIMVDCPDVVKTVWAEIAKQEKIKRAAFAERMAKDLQENLS